MGLDSGAGTGGSGNTRPRFSARTDALLSDPMLHSISWAPGGAITQNTTC